MKNLILLVIMSLFALPAFAGKYQIEETQFDLKSQTSTTTQTNPCDDRYYAEGYIYGRIIDSETLEPLKGISVKMEGIKLKNYNKKYKQNTRTYKNGCFAIDSPFVAAWSKLDIRGTYLITVKSNHYKKYKCVFQYTGSSLDGFDISLNKNAASNLNSTIKGYVFDRGGSPANELILELYGENTKTERKLTLQEEGWFELSELPADKYLLIIEPTGYKTMKMKIRLQKNMTKSFDYTLRKK